MTRDPRDDVKATVAGSGGALLPEDTFVSEPTRLFDPEPVSAPMVHARGGAALGFA